MNFDAKVIDDDDMEDIGLSLLMREVDRTDIASEKEVMAKLNG